MAITGKFRRELMPVPVAFWERELGRRPTRSNSQGWATGLPCPMHKSKSGKSFSVNVRTGAWCCFGGCGKGDMIGFVMTRYHVNFKAAAEYLGAWDGNGSTSRSEIRRQRQARAQEQAEAESQLERRRQDVIDRRTWLHLLERIYKHSNARLSEIRKGAAEQYAGEGETLWGILSDCLPQIRRAAVAYSEAAGVVVAE